MHFKVPPKTFRLDGRITQRIRQWVQNRRTGATEKARLPNVLRRNRGIFSLRRLAERRCWRPETSETGAQQSAKFIEMNLPSAQWLVLDSRTYLREDRCEFLLI